MSKKRLLIVFILLIVAVITATIIYYYGYYIKPAHIYMRSINCMLENNNKLTKNLNYSKYKCDMILDIEIEPNTGKIDKDITNVINNSDISIDTQINKQSKELIINLDTNYNNENLLDLEILTNEDKKVTYIYLKDFLNKYLKVDVNDKVYDYLEELLTINGEKTETNTEALRKELLTLVKPENCSSTKMKILIEGNLQEVSANTLKVKFKDLVNVLKVADKDIEKNEVIKNYDDSEIEFNIYTRGILKDKVQQIDIKIANKQEFIKLSLIDNTCYYELVNEKIALKGNIKHKNQDENKGNIDMVLETQELGKAALKINYELQCNTEMKSVNMNNSSDIDDLTKDEQIIISNNFKKSNLYTLIKKIIENKKE